MQISKFYFSLSWTTDNITKGNIYKETLLFQDRPFVAIGEQDLPQL
jgi:hypothetical protein